MRFADSAQAGQTSSLHAYTSSQSLLLLVCAQVGYTVSWNAVCGLLAHYKAAYGSDILLHLNIANFLPSIPVQLLHVHWHDSAAGDARGGERWLWLRLVLGAAHWSLSLALDQPMRLAVSPTFTCLRLLLLLYMRASASTPALPAHVASQYSAACSGLHSAPRARRQPPLRPRPPPTAGRARRPGRLRREQWHARRAGRAADGVGPAPAAGRGRRAGPVLGRGVRHVLRAGGACDLVRGHARAHSRCELW